MNHTLYKYIDSIDNELWDINQKIHSNPELGYEEFKAHASIVSLLQAHSLHVTPHAFNLPTSFQAEFGTGGRVVTYCAEYDALPGIGHACGHNLIATSSIASFLSLAHILHETKTPGRVRLLGTPAEEGGGGKIKLINAGAFQGVDAAIMTHPTNFKSDQKAGVAYVTCLASARFRVVFKGKGTHAASTPWLGINAMDAATLAYTAIGFLRQQTRPTEVVIAVVKTKDGLVPGIIPDEVTVECNVRCETLRGVENLKERALKCFEGSAIATGCAFEVVTILDQYADLRSNESMCMEFAEVMAGFGKEFSCDLKNVVRGNWGTDMGNVSYVCPGFHGCFAIPSNDDEGPHNREFTAAAGTIEAHGLAIEMAKGMASVGWKLLSDEKFANQVRADFESDKLKR